MASTSGSSEFHAQIACVGPIDRIQLRHCLGVSRQLTRISHNEPVTDARKGNGTGAAGKRAGTRRGSKPKARFQPMALVFTFGITLSVIAWGYLVYFAIRQGQEIRAGDESAWKLVLGSGLGAVLCLFVGFLLVARLLRKLAGTPAVKDDAETKTTAPAGGHRMRSEDS